VEAFFSVMEKNVMAQAGCLENTPLLPQRAKSGSVSGFAALPIGKAAGGSKGV